MPVPTEGPFPWATAAGRRQSPGTGDQTQGAIGGTPVPSLKNNGLWGNFSDWLIWLSGRLTARTLNTARFFCADATWLPEDANSLVKFSLNGIRIESNAGTDAIAYRGWMLPVGGTISTITANVVAQNGGDYDLEVTLYGYDSAGAARNRGWEALAQSATGTITLTPVEGLDLIYGPIMVYAKFKAPPGGGYVTVTTLTLTWSAP